MSETPDEIVDEFDGEEPDVIEPGPNPYVDTIAPPEDDTPDDEEDSDYV